VIHEPSTPEYPSTDMRKVSISQPSLLLEMSWHEHYLGWLKHSSRCLNIKSQASFSDNHRVDYSKPINVHISFSANQNIHPQSLCYKLRLKAKMFDVAEVQIISDIVVPCLASCSILFQFQRPLDYAISALVDFGNMEKPPKIIPSFSN